MQSSNEFFRIGETRVADMWHDLQFCDLTPVPHPLLIMTSWIFRQSASHLVMSSVTGASAVKAIPHPHPPGIMSSSASLLPAPCPEFINVCQPVLRMSAQVLHQGRNSFWVPAGHCICVTGREKEALLIVKYQCAYHKALWSISLNTGGVYKVLSNILGVRTWMYTR